MSDPRRLLAEARAAADRGDPAAALAVVDRLLAVAGEEAGAQRESGLLLAALGRPAAARSALERARSLDPGDAGTAEALARLALADRRVEEAVAGFRQAIRLDPRRVSAHVWLGRALLSADCPAEAVDAFESATRLDPEDPRGFQQLGHLYLQQGLHGSAVACLARAAALAPEAPGPQADLGLANQTAGDLDAAAHAYRKALALDSGHRAALRGLARIAEIRRRPEDGLRLLEPVVAAASADGGLLAQHGALLALSGRREEAISLLEGQLHRPFPDPERVEMGFRLAALYDAAGQHERAFHHAALANRLKAVEFDPAAYRALIDRLLSAFDGQIVTRLHRATRRDERPILIVGMPRSGTSLVEQILASHPAVHGAGELTEIGLMALSTAGGGREYPESVWGLDARSVNAMAAAYGRRLDAVAPRAERIVDKMWQNFEYLGFAAMLLPAARIIWCRRDPADLGLSCFFQHFFGDGVPFAYDLAHIGCMVREHERVMAHWRAVLDLEFLDLTYETLVADPEAQIRRLVKFAGLPWDPACLRFQQTERVVRTASYAQVRRPLYSSSVGRHRAYARWLGPLYRALESA